MTTIEKTYQPEKIEKHWYQTWENTGYFSPSGMGEPYCIMLPPPNVTGSLHMGHGFGYTLMDVLIRYARMSGKNTLWQPGTDHAGIATQMVVERQLNQTGKTRHDLGREKFIEKIWEWKELSGNTITQQLRRLGASVDWSRERFTMDENFSEAVKATFIKLFDEGLIYRGKRLVNWDPVLRTAISDLEVINETVEGNLWHIRYPITGSKEYLVVATTRPETLLGDMAVAVHPDDKRYHKLVGQTVSLPLTDRTIPIIADDYVDKEFGSGCVKITPAHDFNDYKVGSRHNLTPHNIFTDEANLNDNVPEAYRGLSRNEARKKILTDLEANGLLEKTEKHTLNIPRGEKTNAIIEPYLTYQWYLNCQVLAEPAIDAVKKGDIRFIPDNWSKTYFQWMENIEDWCISRQLWWGHRLPVWYDPEGKAYAGQNEEDVRKRYQLNQTISLKQETDVLDTWFSASLWPFVTLGWPNQTEELKKFLPTSVLVTGFDIIFFWVARMIMMSLKFTKKIPFKEVYITGLIRDHEGHKMSKSKGNVIDPIDLIDGIDIDSLVKKRTTGLMQQSTQAKIEAATRKEFKDGFPAFGTDSLRFTFCSFASFTREIKFDVNRLAGYRNFCNKLWNASRFIFMNLQDQTNFKKTPATLSLPDQWILSKLQHTIRTAVEQINNYRFDLFAQTLYDFTWNELCDWYLEFAKPILLQKENSEAVYATQHTLLSVLEVVLRLLHPIIPFITEEIWQRTAPLLGENVSSIMISTYPEFDQNKINDDIENECEWIKAIITGVRTIRSEKNIPPGKLLTLQLRRGNAKDKERTNHNELFLKTLGKIEAINWLREYAIIDNAASFFIGDLECFVPLAGLVNQEEINNRLQTELNKLQKEIDFIDGKLNNQNFVERAPKEVVEKEKEKLAELQLKKGKIEEQIKTPKMPTQ